LKNTLWIWLLLVTVSCGKSTLEKSDQAIDRALSYLSDEKCDAAIDVLEKLGRQNKDPVYLETLASAYACRAKFDMVNFISSDIPNLDTSASGLLKSLTLLSLSAETTVDSSNYVDLKTALGILGTVSTQSARNATFGPRKAGDLGVQLVILSIVELGKFLNYYGNVNASGVKGGGAGASKCFLNYTTSQAQTAVSSGGTGSCVAYNKGHPDLTTVKRKCEGLMLVTNIIDTLPNIDLSGSDSFGNISDISSVVTSIKATALAVDPSLATLLNTTSQSACETLLATPAELDHMELIYAVIFEHYLI
jgi:hypothetical protein